MPNKEKRRTRICWTPEEMQQVAEGAFLIYLESEPMSLWELISEAQSCLPKDRQRVIMGKASVHTDVIAKFNKVRKEYIDELNLVGSISIEIEKETMVEPTTEEFFQKLGTDALVAELVKRATPILAALPKFMEGIVTPEIGQKKEAQEMNRTKTPVQVEQTEKLPKVLLLEFLPAQEENIRRKVLEEDLKVELIFGGKGRRAEIPRTCNWCILNKKTSHAFSDKLNQQIRKDRVFIVTGINSALKRILEITKTKG